MKERKAQRKEREKKEEKERRKRRGGIKELQDVCLSPPGIKLFVFKEAM